jgi:hypothetical protein
VLGIVSSQQKQIMMASLKNYFDNYAVKNHGSLTLEEQQEESKLATQINSGLIATDEQLRSAFNLWKLAHPADRQVKGDTVVSSETTSEYTNTLFDPLFKAGNSEQKTEISSEKNSIFGQIGAGYISDTKDVNCAYQRYICNGMQQTGTNTVKSLNELLSSIKEGSKLILSSIKVKYKSPKFAQDLVDKIDLTVRRSINGSITLQNAVEIAQDASTQLVALNTMVLSGKVSDTIYYQSASPIINFGQEEEAAKKTTKKKSMLQIMGYDSIFDLMKSRSNSSLSSSYDYLASKYKTDGDLDW